MTDHQCPVAKIQSFVKNWAKSLDDAFNTSYYVTNNGQKLLAKSSFYWLTNPTGHEFSLKFDNKTLTGDFYVNGAKQTRTETYSKIKSVQFQLGNEDMLLANTARCLITTVDNSVYTVLLQKETSKSGLSVIFSQPFEKSIGGYNEFTFISSADWDSNLQELDGKLLSDLKDMGGFSAAYQYAALSTLRIQVDYQRRMTMEAFSAAYDAKWEVSLLNAGGKVAYKMRLKESEFKAADHRISFFIEQGSILFDGTPVEPMGYTRKAGGIGTKDWHPAAEMTYSSQHTANNMVYFDFDTNVFWDELDATVYDQVQYQEICKLYGLSDEFYVGVENGIYITLNNVYKHVGAYEDNKLSVTLNNSGPRNTVRVQIGLHDTLIGSAKDVTFNFSTVFMLPDGTPLREENTFRCNIGGGSSTSAAAVGVTAGGDFFTGSNGTSSGNPLVDHKQFHMDFIIQSPWADKNHSSYSKLETKPSSYGLSTEFYNSLLNNIFIGVNGNEVTLNNAINKYKLSVSLINEGGDRTILRLTINTSDMTASDYPLDLTKHVFSIRFGNSYKNGINTVLNPFCLPNKTPVRFVNLVRPAADFSTTQWVIRHSLSSEITSSQSGNTVKIDFTSNGLWQLPASRFYEVLSKGQGFPTAFLNSLKNKIELKIDSTTKTLAQWGVNHFEVEVFEKNGNWALQLQIKDGLVTNKNLTIKFVDGFVGPDGSTLVVPIDFIRTGDDTWTDSSGSSFYVPNRTIAIQNTSFANPSMTVSLPSGSFNGTAPFKIYAKVKLKNAASISGTGTAKIVLDYASSPDVELVSLTSDTDDWQDLTVLHGKDFEMKKENANIVFSMNNMSGQFTIADLIVADANGKILYSMANDTTLYGVGDMRNVNSKLSKWTIQYDTVDLTTTKVFFPIVTRGDSRYVPNRILKVVVDPGYTGGDASVIIAENQFANDVTYYVTGRIRANVTGKTNGVNAGSNSANVVVNGVGDSKYYGVPNGEWVALVNADGTPLSFIGGVKEIPTETITTPHRSISIHTKHDMTYGRMAIDGTASATKFGANKKLYVRGYYKVEEFKSLASDGCAYIGDGADYGRIKVTGNQTTWKYFKVEWTTGNTLFFSLYNANGYLRLANLTIEDANRNVVYDMSTDTALGGSDITYRTDFPWNPSIWYITYTGEPDAMDLSVEKATSATPLQYTHTRNDTGKTLANGSEHRTISIHSKYGATNGKMSIQMDQFKSKYSSDPNKYGSGTFTVRGFYKVEEFKAINSGGKYEIGDGSSNMITGTANKGWTYFQLTWSPTANLNFEFHDAMGYIRLANVTIENSKYQLIYDMGTDADLDGTYYTTFPQKKGIWYITCFGTPGKDVTVLMDLSISAKSTGTPMQYTATIGSVKRQMALNCIGNTINAKMQVYGSKFASEYGAGTYTVSGYFKVTGFKAVNATHASFNIGTGATSGKVNGKSSVDQWTYFTLQWNTSNDLIFEFYYATGWMGLGNLTFINANGGIVYDLSTDTSLPTGWQTGFPQEPHFWYWGYNGAKEYMDMSIEAATSGSPSRNADGHSENAIDNIADSAVKRSMSIHTNHYLKNGKLVITTADAKAKFGAGKTMIVRGYYKVTDYKAIGDSPWWQVGSNADSGHTGHKTGNQTTWKYFKIYWNTNNDLNFEFWNANGYLRLANVTIEDLNGGVWYDMSTDTALGGTSTNYQNIFPQHFGIWTITNEGNLTFMDISVSAKKTTATPKSYTPGSIVETPQALSTPKRMMSIGTKNGLENGKMVITATQAAAKFGSNKNMIVRGYFKIESYTKVADGDCYKIGTNSDDMIKGQGNKGWTYFKLRWNTSKDLNFEFMNANGFLRLANLTIEEAASGSLGNIVYDMSTDTALFPDGCWYKGIKEFPKNPSIWYITYNADFNFMDISNTPVAAATPKQYAIDNSWDYLKFTMWYATGSMEVADLTIYHYVNGTKVIDYSMATDKNFESDYSRPNNDSALFTVWRSEEWASGFNCATEKNFTVYIDYNSNQTHYDSEYTVPKPDGEYIVP